MINEKEIISKLIGKTIKSARIERFSSEYDDKLLILEMTDGSVFRIVPEYGSYTGNSIDEYPSYIEIYEEAKNEK